MIATDSSSVVSISPVLFMLCVSGAGVIALTVARRLWLIELLFAGVFFTLLGGTPAGQAFYGWINSIPAGHL